jgi:hypothetical protein
LPILHWLEVENPTQIQQAAFPVMPSFLKPDRVHVQTVLNDSSPDSRWMTAPCRPTIKHVLSFRFFLRRRPAFGFRHQRQEHSVPRMSQMTVDIDAACLDYFTNQMPIGII